MELEVAHTYKTRGGLQATVVLHEYYHKNVIVDVDSR